MSLSHAARRLLTVLAAGLTLPLVAVTPAAAAPPEGCIGFPSIPEAFVCIVSWTPEDVVPSVGLGPDQTVYIPEFCVFECFGPTPVDIPGVTVTVGDGQLAVVRYRGQDYAVGVPGALGLFNMQSPCDLYNGPVDPRTNTQQGILKAGPWTPPGGSARDIVITCDIQVGNSWYTAPNTVTVSSEPRDGYGYLPPTPITYPSAGTSSTHICTTVRWTNADGTTGSYPLVAYDCPYSKLTI